MSEICNGEDLWWWSWLEISFFVGHPYHKNHSPSSSSYLNWIKIPGFSVKKDFFEYILKFYQFPSSWLALQLKTRFGPIEAKKYKRTWAPNFTDKAPLYTKSWGDSNKLLKYYYIPSSKSQGVRAFQTSFGPFRPKRCNKHPSVQNPSSNFHKNDLYHRQVFQSNIFLKKAFKTPNFRVKFFLLDSHGAGPSEIQIHSLILPFN